MSGYADPNGDADIYAYGHANFYANFYANGHAHRDAYCDTNRNADPGSVFASAI